MVIRCDEYRIMAQVLDYLSYSSSKSLVSDPNVGYRGLSLGPPVIAKVNILRRDFIGLLTRTLMVLPYFNVTEVINASKLILTL